MFYSRPSDRPLATAAVKARSTAFVQKVQSANQASHQFMELSKPIRVAMETKSSLAPPQQPDTVIVRPTRHLDDCLA